MILKELKKIRDELKESAASYDEAFKDTAIIATQSLLSQEQIIDDELNKNQKTTVEKSQGKILPQTLTKEYFLDKYGSLKKAKEAYQNTYGNKKYGRSWQDFLAAVSELPLIKKQELTLEERITRIENILKSMGHEL